MCIRDSYMGWTSEETAVQVRVRLQGDAADAVEDAEPRPATWEAMKTVLHDRFGPTGTSNVFRAQLDRRQRRPNEDLQSYAQDIQRLGALAYPGATAQQKDGYLLGAFGKGLGDRVTETQIHMASSQPGFGVKEALQMALLAEAFDKAPPTTRDDKTTPIARVATSDPVSYTHLTLPTIYSV